jgi:hypothetical protein
MEHDKREVHQVSRRGLVVGVAGGAAVGAAAIASGRASKQGPATAVAGASQADAARLSSAALASTASTSPAATEGEPLVVHVRDVRSGALDFYSGTRHIAVIDQDLAARLAAHTA